MADLNTKIRGAQIKNLTITVEDLANDAVETAKIKDDNVTNDKLANISRGFIKVGGAADAPTDLDAKSDGYILIGDGTDIASVAVSGDITITNAGVTAIGADKVTKTEINADVAGDGLAQAAGGELDLDLNELTAAVVDVANDSIAIVDADDDSSKKEAIVDLVSAMAGSGLTATNGVLSADTITDNLIEADILFENESANCNGSNVTFTLASSPVSNSVQVFLNGLIQEEGSGKDYTIAGTTLTFATAPVTNDILLVYYIRND